MSQVVYATEDLTGAAQRSSAPNTPLTRYIPVAGRALMATIFLMSGLSKVTAPDATTGYIEVAGLPMSQVALAAAVLIEIAGGLLLLAGYRTRLTALLLAGFTVATAFGFHANFADQNQTIHFLKSLAIACGLLQVPLSELVVTALTLIRRGADTYRREGAPQPHPYCDTASARAALQHVSSSASNRSRWFTLDEADSLAST